MNLKNLTGKIIGTAKAAPLTVVTAIGYINEKAQAQASLIEVNRELGRDGISDDRRIELLLTKERLEAILSEGEHVEAKEKGESVLDKAKTFLGGIRLHTDPVKRTNAIIAKRMAYDSTKAGKVTSSSTDKS